MRLYDETCLALCEGQFLDIRASESQEWMSVEYYLDMIGRKTAALIAGSVKAGAMLATDDAAVVEAYRSFGWALGMAFQINDDLLGIWGDEQATGKQPSDIEARKQTLPLLHALEHAVEADRDRLEAILHGPPPTADDVDRGPGHPRAHRLAPVHARPGRLVPRGGDAAAGRVRQRRRRGDGAPATHRGVRHHGLNAARPVSRRRPGSPRSTAVIAGP